VSTLKQRRKHRGVKLLLIGAVVAFKLVAPGASRAQDVSWASQPHAAVTTNMSARASAQGEIKAGTILGGFTSQGWPVVLELARGGKSVILGAAGLDVTCTSGDQFPVEDGWQLLTVAQNGRVNASEQIPAQQGQGTTLTGGSHSLKGRFNRHRSTFRGTWQMQLNFKNADGSTDSCQSGPVTFSAAL
jgi:hypothetical protein